MRSDLPGVLPVEASELLISSLSARELIDAIRADDSARRDVLRGFRPTALAAKNPAVIQRVLTTLQFDERFRTLLSGVWVLSHQGLAERVGGIAVKTLPSQLGALSKEHGGANVYLALLLDARRGVAKLAAEHKAELLASPAESNVRREVAPKPPRQVDRSAELQESIARANELQKDNRRLARELMASEKSLSATKSELETLRAKLKTVSQAVVEATRATSRTSTDLTKARNKVSELDRTVKDLRRALDAKEAAPRISRASEIPWQSAVEAMLKSGRSASAIEFLRALCEAVPNDPTPRETLFKAFAATKDRPEQLKQLVWLGRHYLQAGNIVAAVDRLSLALVLKPSSSDVRSQLSSALSRVDPRNEKRTAEVRRILRKLRLNAPVVHTIMMTLAAQVSSKLSDALSHIPTGDESGVPVRLEGGQSVRPGDLIHAVYANDLDAVQDVRPALRSDPRAGDVKRLVDESDPSCWTALTAETTTVIVDASNVAHFMTGAGKARLGSLLAVRRELHKKRYFPVYLIADAALPYQIDDPERLRRMAEDGEIEMVAPGTVADEVIISLARRLKCPVVTRDAMSEWDPSGEVDKIRFDIDRNSAEVIDTEW